MDLKTAYETIENCRYCLMCRHVAPVGIVTHQEALTPHGMALTAASQKRDLIEWDAETAALIFSEVDGGNSRAHCVTDQPFEEAMAAVRAELVEAGHSPAAVAQLAKAWRNGHSPFGQNESSLSFQQGESALFIGDEAHFLRPQMVEAAEKLLAAVGIIPIRIGIGQGSGLLAASVGLPAVARQQAEAIMDVLETMGARRLLVLSAGDRYTFRQGNTERLGIEWPVEVEVVEVMAVLAEAGLSLRQSAENFAYAYVDPTHAVRVPGRHDAPRQLLAATLPSEPLELFWRRERAHPVGSTAVQFTQPKIAEALTRARLQDAKNSGAEVIFCEDAATLAQLERYAAEYGLRVEGLYEWLADHVE